ncbi:hypothetical protein BO82DRAFT_399497 [Aspergillus uvarum CBS 121591]|uniref:Uncharacterized protein n=1 Tax=Aspergillus uvarum CBS 121591 TaxID=1448315 RepID=A0A319CJX1_9EURO|nr:hypothetical protein BO82DRAFT_399497 [Aspergillus uvarum CBS 121591]PYH84669.1 hypothetical protein BO82DRAFT_399497 [Aspergillus uvarum CBS 121591]
MSQRAVRTNTAAAATAAAASGAGGRKPNQGGGQGGGGGKGNKAPGSWQDRKHQHCTRCSAFGHTRAVCTRFVPPGTPRFVRPAHQHNNARSRRAQRRAAAGLAWGLEAGEAEEEEEKEVKKEEEE